MGDGAIDEDRKHSDGCERTPDVVEQECAAEDVNVWTKERFHVPRNEEQAQLRRTEEAAGEIREADAGLISNELAPARELVLDLKTLLIPTRPT